MVKKRLVLAIAGLAVVSTMAYGRGGQGNGGGGASACAGLPTQAALKNALIAAVTTESSGLDFEMWATIVDRDGVVCAVAFSGADRQSQWPGSRVISAQKANTANAFSLPGLALSTANLFTAVQPGGSLFGLQESNPVDPQVAYDGNPKFYGTANDPLTGKRMGGINVFEAVTGLSIVGNLIKDCKAAVIVLG